METTRIASGVRPREMWIYRRVDYGWARKLRRLWRGVIHTGDIFLCAACYRTSPPWYHLGPNLRDDPTAWVQECRAAGAGLPTAVVKTFFPSGACLCSLGDYFFETLREYQAKRVRAFLAARTRGVIRGMVERELGSTNSISRGKGLITPTAACGRRMRLSLRQAIFATRVT